MRCEIPLPALALALALLPACDQESPGPADGAGPAAVSAKQTGWLASSDLFEVSGLQASHSQPGHFYVHNDDGETPIYVIDQGGADLGAVDLVPAKNLDWEDITSVPVADGRWIVIGDIGDNQAARKSIRLYFAREPQPDRGGHYRGRLDLQHWLELTYPDGPRDCESMAYDPLGRQILLLSKRDRPARLYAVNLETALTRERAELTFLGSIAPLRPPSAEDYRDFGGRTDWISQPTGFDIAAGGGEAVVVTYRSVYRFRRQGQEDWLSALRRTPEEFVGPPAVQNEAIAYSADGHSVLVTTEQRPAPVYRLDFRPAR